MIRRTLIGLAALCLGVCVAAAQTLTFPQLTGRVVDAAGIVDGTVRDDVGHRLAAFEERSGTKIVVATVPSLQGADIESYATQLANTWHLGRDGKNGAILLIAPDVGKVAIHVGENLRGRLTDDVLSQVIQRTLVPRLAVDDISGGVRGGVDRMIALLDGTEPNVAVAPVRATAAQPGVSVAGQTQMAQADTGVTTTGLNFPALTGRVVDEAGILDTTTRSALDKISSDLEAKSTDQLVIVTLRSLRGTSIEDYGYQLGRAWQIGQKGKNNGVLLIVAPNERKARIEVGYGLEGTLTDAISSFIMQNAILPRFKAGDFPGGIKRGAEDIVSVLTGDEEYKQRATQSAARSSANPDQILIMIFFVVIAGIIFFNVIFGIIQAFRPYNKKRKRSWWDDISIGSSSGSSGSSWSSGSSSSGGGFSGGGGSFGGGGSSGSW